MMSDECQSKMSANVGGGMAAALFGCQHPPGVLSNGTEQVAADTDADHPRAVSLCG